MKLCKNTTIRFIFNGKHCLYKLLYYDLFKELIPIYICDNICKTQIIQLEDNSIFIVTNNTNIDELEIWHNILKIYYKDKASIRIIDLHCAYWFGFSNMIEHIKTLNNISESEKNIRINTLEKVLANNINAKILTQEYILKNLKFLEVN